MPKKNMLPGFDRLLAVLSQFGVTPEIEPPSPKAPLAGDRVLGAPFDPMLAALYARINGRFLGDLSVYGFDEDTGRDLIKLNTSFRECEVGHPFDLREILYYAQEFSMAYRFAVVPSLANVEGVQPVLYLDEYDEVSVLPFASSVDKAFDLWARFCEVRFRRRGEPEQLRRLSKAIVRAFSGRDVPEDPTESEEHKAWSRNMMLDVPGTPLEEHRLVAEDKELVRMMKAGNFDRFIGDNRYSRNWMDSVIRASQQ